PSPGWSPRSSWCLSLIIERRGRWRPPERGPPGRRSGCRSTGMVISSPWLLPVIFGLLLFQGFPNQVPNVGGGFGAGMEIIPVMRLFLVGFQLADRQADTSFGGRAMDHLGPDGVPHLEAGYLVPPQLGDMDQAFDTLFHFHEETEVGNVSDGPGHDGTHRKALIDGFPGVGGQVLDAQGKAFIFLIDVKYLGLYHLALLVDLRGVFEPLGPRDVGDVYQAVDAFVDADEDAEVGDVLNLAFDDRPHRVFLADDFPGVGFHLFQAERDAL